MIVVKVEIWPGGNHRRAKEITRIGIANTAGTEAAADYSAIALGPSGRPAGVRVLRHRRGAGWVPLVMRVLHGLGEPRRRVPQGEVIVRALRQEGSR